jgi:hypothetical protein
MSGGAVCAKDEAQYAALKAPLTAPGGVTGEKTRREPPEAGGAYRQPFSTNA